MVATGALRAGAGMARVISDDANRLPVQSILPEAIFVDRHGEGVDEAVETSDALVVGPGIGTDDGALALARRVLGQTGVPTVLDADALTLLARHPDLLQAGPHALLTPHPGEMARLLSIPTEEVVRDPFAAVTRAAERFGCTVLLKGWPSLVAGGEGPVLANVTGHSGVATGGMGDTLAGIAGAMLALSLAPREAAALAIFFAGRAADLAGRGRALLPRDVADALPAAFAEDAAELAIDFPDVVLDLAPAT